MTTSSNSISIFDRDYRELSDGERPDGTKPRLPSLDPAAPAEPVFSRDQWLGERANGSVADHPLLQGLLLELPPKGVRPPAEWLDRWFEATRSILELLYGPEHH